MIQSGPPIICFGEILWDALPQGLFLGGAPFNVAYHLHRHGNKSMMVSAVGNDFLGQEAQRRAKAYGMAVEGMGVVNDQPTGAVQVSLSEKGDASYTILEPVAWDFIEVPPKLPDGFSDEGVVVFGSLALRSEKNRTSLKALRESPKVRAVCDINLRAPYDDLEQIRQWIHGVSLLKLNEEEAARLANVSTLPEDPRPILERLSLAYEIPSLVVTRGGDGAWLWGEGELISTAAPSVNVKDTIGAGDAFMAAFLSGWVRPHFFSRAREVMEHAVNVGAFVASVSGAQPDYDPDTLAIPG
jgi:fructokinase